MSKSIINVIYPVGITEQYGTDAVRYTLASQASPGTDIAFNEKRTEGYRAFANKIWNAARFLFMNVDRAEQAGVFSLREFTQKKAIERQAPSPGEAQTELAGFSRATLEDRWILSRFHRVAEQID